MQKADSDSFKLIWLRRSRSGGRECDL